MNKYRVYGHTTVTVAIDVVANSKKEAYEVALDERAALTAYVGNGGLDKLIGVDGEDESVSADCEIKYDDIELLEKNFLKDVDD